MNILLLGSGGREHALAWKLSQSPLCSALYIAPGNTGTAICGTNLSFSATDFAAVTDCCKEKKIDLVVVGPEDPLVKGITDHLRGIKDLGGLMIIGPSAEAAQLEGSKAYAKKFMALHNIPTAAYREFTAADFDEGIKYLRTHQLPVVLKADGLAAGKGVIICEDHEQAVTEFTQMLKGSKFGEAGSKVVVEEFLSGIELSVFALTDGKDYVLLPEAKDYKRIGEGDTGLNTGGMGAISPVPFADEAFMKKVKERIVEPTIKGLEQDQLDYKGFVFFGLIKVNGDPFVIEYNCRMGDPETEVVMPRLENDLVELFIATAKGKLKEQKIRISPSAAATIVAVSGGYPNDFRKGLAIKGLDAQQENTLVFHAGTKEVDGQILTNGGRVFCVTSLAPGIQQAVLASGKLFEKIHFEDMYYRKDIGYEFTHS